MTKRDDSRPAGKPGKNRDPRGESSSELPAVARYFSVSIDEVEIGLSSLSRLGSETVCEEPAKTIHRYPNVVLRRALGRDRRLFEWREAILAGRTDKRQVTIRQLGAAGGEPRNTWILEGAWPCRWAGPIFDANATELAMEEIELTFDRLAWR
jgi:phage tail-like protein